MEDPYEGPADIVVAEHWSRGGFYEDAIGPTRKGIVHVDPTFTIPHAVTPYAVAGILPHPASRTSDNHILPVHFEDLQFIEGERVRLACRQDLDHVLIRGGLQFTSAEQYMGFGADIEWASPEVDPTGELTQSIRVQLQRQIALLIGPQKFPRNRIFRSHLMDLAGLNHPGSLERLQEIKEVLGLASHYEAQEQLFVRYPFGVATSAGYFDMGLRVP